MASTESNPDLSTEDDSLKKQLNSPLHNIDTTPKAVEETKSSDSPRLKQEDQPGHENGEAVRKRVNSDLIHQKRRVSDHSKRVVRPNAGQDRSVERSPLHLSKVGEKGLGGSSSSLERKEGSHGASSTPGRRLRSVNWGDEADESSAVPPFGGWDENNPAASDQYTQLFNRVREERQNAGGATPNILNGQPSPGGTRRGGAASSSSKSCCCFCFPCGKK